MKKVISFLLAAVLLLTAFSGCASSQKPQAITTKPISIDGTEAVGFTDFDHQSGNSMLVDDVPYLRREKEPGHIDSFCYRDYAEVLTESAPEQENFTVSPLSFKAALVLLLEGADGESKRQLLDALGFSSVEEAEKWYASVLENEKAFAEWTDDSEESAYRVINSIWHNTSLPGAWIDEYVSAVSEKLRASAYEKPASQITEAVNDWAREQTNVYQYARELQVLRRRKHPACCSTVERRDLHDLRAGRQYGPALQTEKGEQRAGPRSGAEARSGKLV